ncbi:hypothetical protein ACFL27_09450 [candidate division CSSED10-310 bacterium]|uniref:Mechanosensitive ion channel family protein n=1 Tax=candidate division CSSED10-310 bacterium TaxID=2855610 RepID=A0ABV6YW18_UNCC1
MVKKSIKFVSLWVLTFFILFYTVNITCGQDIAADKTPGQALDQPTPQPPAPEQATAEEPSAEQPGLEQLTPVPGHIRKPSSLMTLEDIVKTIEKLNYQLEFKNEELKTISTDEQKKEILQDINEINSRITILRDNFSSIASGIDLDTFANGPQKKFDWKEELQDVLGPIFGELKSLTAQPREMEKLRSELAFYEKRILVVQNALKNIQDLSGKTNNQILQEYLHSLEQEWEENEQDIINQINITGYKLDEKLKQKKSLVESTQNIVRIFFKSRGRNLVFSLLAFVIVFFLLRLLHRLIHKILPFYTSGKRPFYVRLADVLYHAFTFIGAVTALLTVLYISGDWVLLGLAILFLFGVGWTAKQGLPIFWEQAKLLLNLGTVRENERVIFEGIPWKVESLNLYTHLVNPELKGGMIRLPLLKLVGLYSRPFHPAEPWFPCREGDWVLLADQTHGKVINQTPEVVQLILRGGSCKTYLTQEFLIQNPQNISRNFRLLVTFGIDYQHQADCTRDIPGEMKQMLLEGLSQIGHGDDIINLDVEFKEAGSSSLDYAIVADFSGRVAEKYDTLRRTLQRFAVDACNKWGWIIPFTQITMHTSTPLPEQTESGVGETD